jgi:hypothetical protein
MPMGFIMVIRLSPRNHFHDVNNKSNRTFAELFAICCGGAQDFSDNAQRCESVAEEDEIAGVSKKSSAEREKGQRSWQQDIIDMMMC